MEGPRSKFYHDLVTLDSYEGNKLSRSIALMDSAPDAAGLKLAWQQALKFAGPNPDMRVDLALRALHMYPRLHAESVDVLAREAQPRTRMFLRDMANHYDERVATRARQGLQQIDLSQRLNDLNDSMSSSANLADRLKAAEAAAATRTPQAASAIIKSYLNASTDAEQIALAQVMRKYISPEIWKFELRRQKAANPAQTPTLDRLMNGSHKIAAKQS
jgi:hypothetical protein